MRQEECVARFTALTDEQAAKAQEVIKEAFRVRVLDDEQIPQALELLLGIIEEVSMCHNPYVDEEEEENIVYLPPYVELSSRKKSQYKSAPLEEVEEIVYLPYIQIALSIESPPSVPQPFDKDDIGLEEEDNLDRLFRKKDSTKALTQYPQLAEIGAADGTFTLGLCHKQCEKDEEVELEVETDKYEDKRKEEEKDLPNDQTRVVEIGSSDKTNTVGPCYEKGNGVKKDEKVEFEVEKDELEELKPEEESREDKAVDKEDLNESDRETLVDEDIERNERDEDKSEIPLTGEVLRRACESWIKAVEEFRRVEEKSYVDNKLYLDRTKDGFVTGQFDPGRPYSRNGKSLEKAYKKWKEKINRFLRRNGVEREYVKMDVEQEKPLQKMERTVWLFFTGREKLRRPRPGKMLCRLDREEKKIKESSDQDLEQFKDKSSKEESALCLRI
ncbi:hypothetical protein C2G38_2221393 [Gigaspora rosea]|uniref:Uncharacterized protein n=1 Tax=Gigaspora rosea TaxID=44941 RepID=A0A397U3F7_9GLOM|nr:hypothetical protein C2G38_2221393 [Gigaspora rosea]